MGHHLTDMGENRILIMNECYLVELEMGSMLAGIHCTNVEEKEYSIHLLAGYQNVEQILQKKKEEDYHMCMRWLFNRKSQFPYSFCSSMVATWYMH